MKKQLLTIILATTLAIVACKPAKEEVKEVVICDSVLVDSCKINSCKVDTTVIITK